MKKLSKPFLSCVLGAILALPASAQSGGLTQQADTQSGGVAALLSGNGAPLTLKLGDLDSHWRVFTLDTSSGVDYSAILSAAYGGASTSDYFTRGDTTAVGDDTYLIAYKVHQDPPNYSAMMQPGHTPKIAKLTAATVLDLSILNLHAVGSLNGVHAFDLKQEIAESQKTADSLNSLYGGMTTKSYTTAVDVSDSASSDSGDTASSSESRLKQLGLAYLQFVQDNDDKLPAQMDPASVQKVLAPYVKSKDVFLQPGVNKPYLTNTRLKNHTVAEITDPAGMVVFYEQAPGGDGSRWVCLADGHVRHVTASEWVNLKKASKIP